MGAHRQITADAMKAETIEATRAKADASNTEWVSDLEADRPGISLYFQIMSGKIEALTNAEPALVTMDIVTTAAYTGPLELAALLPKLDREKHHKDLLQLLTQMEVELGQLLEPPKEERTYNRSHQPSAVEPLGKQIERLSDVIMVLEGHLGDDVRTNRIQAMKTLIELDLHSHVQATLSTLPPETLEDLQIENHTLVGYAVISGAVKTLSVLRDFGADFNEPAGPNNETPVQLAQLRLRGKKRYDVRDALEAGDVDVSPLVHRVLSPEECEERRITAMTRKGLIRAQP